MNSTGSYWVLPSFSDFFSWGILGAGPGLPRVQHKGCHGAIETDVGGMKAGRRRQLIAVDFGYVIHVHGNVVFFFVVSTAAAAAAAQGHCVYWTMVGAEPHGIRHIEHH